MSKVVNDHGNSISSVGITVFPKDGITDEVLQACSHNFSKFYGVWQETSRGRVKMGKAMLTNAYLSDDNCHLVIAFDYSLQMIVGHAFFKVFQSGTLSRKTTWITQLVVNSAFRKLGIAQSMLNAAIVPSCTCAGLVSSHPFAVRALEKAMRTAVDPALCKFVAPRLLQESQIAYLQGCDCVFDDEYCLLSTKFFVDHAEPQQALANLGEDPWHLGGLLDGHEFIAIVTR